MSRPRLIVETMPSTKPMGGNRPTAQMKSTDILLNGKPFKVWYRRDLLQGVWGKWIGVGFTPNIR